MQLISADWQEMHGDARSGGEGKRLKWIGLAGLVRTGFELIGANWSAKDRSETAL
jgi:hypothetical protein